MKKLTTLIIIMLLTAGMALAQGNHAASIDQVGNSNASTIDQDAHFGTGHTATSIQNGNSNSSNIVQEQANAEAYISQIGNGNTSDLKQAGFNDADARFNGNGNILGSYNNLGSGVAFQKNGTGIFADGFNKLNLDADGNNNLFGVDQEGGTDGKIELYGNQNEIGLYQRDDNSSNTTIARLYVDGDRNSVDVQQGSGLTETDNYANLDIVGNDNLSTVMQETSFNNANVDVWGNGNTSSITQN